MAKHRGIKRIIHRVLEELCATARIARKTSLQGALTTFMAKIDIQRMNRNGYRELPAMKKRLLAKHDVMLQYFEKEFASFTKSYDYDRPLPETEPALRNRIWMCWWQGIENAPDLTKACIKSVQKNAGIYTVTVITENNYKDYIDVPDWIGRKFQNGVISRTHFSDYLRCSLLAAYGGIWLDSSIYCNRTSLDMYMNLAVWSIKRPGYCRISVASGNFATYSFGCGYENRWIFATIRDFLQYYWKKNDMLIDYLMLDYLIVLAQRKDHRIAEAFCSIEPNNPCCDELVKFLNQPFDKSVWEEVRKDTALFKLTWKQDFVPVKDGKETFYAKLLDGTL